MNESMDRRVERPVGHVTRISTVQALDRLMAERAGGDRRPAPVTHDGERGRQ